jgi:hypothetical protein
VDANWTLSECTTARRKTFEVCTDVQNIRDCNILTVYISLSKFSDHSLKNAIKIISSIVMTFRLKQTYIYIRNILYILIHLAIIN